MTFLPASSGAPVSQPARDVWLSLRRGFFGHCPKCGEGAIFGRYLKVNAECPVCHEELHHQRADDAPPYFTMMVVGHVVVGAMLAVEEFGESFPIWAHLIVWPVMVLGLSLALLPRIKGALIGYQWALRMHGFSHVDDGENGQRISRPATA